MHAMKLNIIFMMAVFGADAFVMQPPTVSLSPPLAVAHMPALKGHAVQAVALRKRGGPVMATPPVGAQAPEFALPSDSGKMVSLKDLRGKWVVVYFYPKVFTQGCTCQVLGISTNPMEKIKEFKEKYGLSFPMLSDRECKTVEAYGAAMKVPFLGTFANRFTFIIDPKGQLRASFAVSDPKQDSVVSYDKLLELQKSK